MCILCFQILYFALLVNGMFQVSEASCTADFLGIYQRFNTSIYDSYYCCNVCGGLLVWQVNNVTAAAHVDATIGRLISDSTANFNSVSMILSVRRNEETCIDSVLIVSQTESNYAPNVTCTGNSQCRVSYSSSIEYTPESMSSGRTQMEQILDQNDIVYPNNSCATQILICQTNDMVLKWTREEIFVAGYTEADSPGVYNFSVHPLDSSIVQSLTAVLEMSANNIISVIIWTDFDSVGSFNVSCSSTMDKTTLLVNQPTFTTDDNSDAAVASTQAYSTQQSLDSNNTLTSAGRRVSLSPSKLIYIISYNYTSIL